jgi:hypothetical protein
MAVLHIALESGFSGDEVVVAVDGKEVLRETLSTRMQIGLAEEVHVPVEPGRHTVSVSARGAAADVAVQVEDELYLGASLSRSGDAIEHRVGPQPFGYL